MESPLSQDSIHMPVEDSRCQTELRQVSSTQPVQVISAGCDYMGPATSEGHNSFVLTPFLVFLDSMESPWSQDSIHIPLEDSRCQVELVQVRSSRLSQVSSAGFDYV